MIAALGLAVAAALGGPNDGADGAANDTVALYDLRWIEALGTPTPFRPDPKRTGAIRLDDLVRDIPMLTAGHPIEREEWDAWIAVRHPDVSWRAARSELTGRRFAAAPPAAHARMRADLDSLRAALREPLRVRWLELGDEVEATGGVVGREEVARLGTAAGTRVLHEQPATPGRGVLLRSREFAAAIIDYDTEGRTSKPNLDPNVGVLRSGEEAAVLSIPEANGDWDLRLLVQDAGALPATEWEFPTGGERVQLTAMRWASVSASARVPDGGGFVFLADSSERSRRWLFTVERTAPRATNAARFRGLGRLARTDLDLAPDRLSRVSPSGGDWLLPGWSWPRRDQLAPRRPLLTLDPSTLFERSGRDEVTDDAFRLGPLVDVGDEADPRVVRTLDEMTERYANYRVELRVVRESAAGNAFRNDHSAPGTIDIVSAVRAGDVLAVSLQAQRAYAADADVEISGTFHSPDPIQASLSTGTSVYVRCLPTRRGSIDVTCRVQNASTSRESETGRCVSSLFEQADAWMREERGESPDRVEVYDIELPQQSLVDLRAKFLTAPGEWQVVGSAPIPDSVDELRVWLRVTEPGL